MTPDTAPPGWRVGEPLRALVTPVKIVNANAMVAGLRWVGLGLLFALACGRTTDSEKHAARGGSSVGGSAEAGADRGGASSGGSGPVSNAGEAGDGGAPDCPVTPAEGQWVAVGPDLYGLKLYSDGSSLSGEGCLGGLPSPEDHSIACTPLVVQADRGRSFAFFWDAKETPDATSQGYQVKMELTLAPDRTAMAGTVWTSLGGSIDDAQGLDIALVRTSAESVPEATTCSDKGPSGACFLAPLRSDRVREPRVVELGRGRLLLTWLNDRGQGNRIASARFDAETTAWHVGEFLDDGTVPVESSLLTASPEGWAMVAYRQGSSILARAYDPNVDSWSEQQVVVKNGQAPNLNVDALSVYDGGDALLVVSALDEQGVTELSTHDYVATTATWAPPHILENSPNIASFAWTAASDPARRALAAWVRGGDTTKPHELWFSSRGAGGTWTEPALVYETERQIVAPEMAMRDGTTIVIWHEFLERIASSFYSFETSTWSPPLTVTSEQGISMLGVGFNYSGNPVTYFESSSLTNAREQKSEFTNGAWNPSQPATEDEIAGNSHVVTREGDAIWVRPLHPLGTMAPAYVRPRCDGY